MIPFRHIAVIASLIASGAVAEDRAATPVPPGRYLSYDCDTLSVFDETLRREIVGAGKEELLARYGDYEVAANYATATPEQAAARLAWLRGHLDAVRAEYQSRNCVSKLSGGVGSGSIWSMKPARIIGFRKAIQTAPFQAAPPSGAASAAAASDRVIRPMPTGANVAPPVNYSAAEVARYCEEGWDHRRLSNGMIEYNPCFYK